MLELQQQLAVAISTDRKKETMIENLDKVCTQSDCPCYAVVLLTFKQMQAPFVGFFLCANSFFDQRRLDAVFRLWPK